MAPNLLGNSGLYLTEANSAEPVQIISTKPDVQYEIRPKTQVTTQKSTEPQYRWQIVWRNVFIFIYLHSVAIYGLYQMFTGHVQWRTILWGYIVALAAGQGITSGAHRLWAHRTYKAKLPLRIILGIFQTMALQNHIYEWVRDHRVHHKFTDTDADPHNARRGFFFSHIGWLMVKKHKDVFAKGKTVDLSDLEEDPVVRFQRKYYVVLAPICCIVLPAFVPWYFWNENWLISFHIAGITRYTLSLNGTWLVNSAAHIWGTKPYDNNIKPVENTTVSIIAFGEGWHNYHHVFPWDYKAAELGNYRTNFSTAFIDFMARIGWAYDLKTVSVEMIKKRVKRTGDGTWDSKNAQELDQGAAHVHNHDDAIWGWGDKDMKENDISCVEIHHQKTN